MKDQSKLPIWTFWLGIALLGVVLTWNNALTTTADLERNQVGFKNWQPYVWEYSSFISTYLLYFGVYWLAKKVPLNHANWVRNLGIHLLASVVFSVLHVLLMVWLRQIFYWLLGGQYEFGEWFSEWLYEYRKDLITYFIFLLTVYAFQYFSQPSENQKSQVQPEKLQVKNKQGVFWVTLSDITTIESGGNYVYIHANQQVLPMRATMTNIERQLNSSDFIRVHRSYLVNLNQCKGIKNPAGDSSELILMNDKSVPVSKKYRPKLMSALQHIELNNGKLKT